MINMNSDSMLASGGGGYGGGSSSDLSSLYTTAGGSSTGIKKTGTLDPLNQSLYNQADTGDSLNYGMDVNTDFTQLANPTVNSNPLQQQSKGQWFSPNAANWTNTYKPGQIWRDGNLEIELFRPEVQKYLQGMGFDTNKMWDQQAYDLNGNPTEVKQWDPTKSIADHPDEYAAFLRSQGGLKTTSYLDDFLKENNLGSRYGNQGNNYVNQLFNTQTGEVLAADHFQDESNWMQKNGWMIPLAALGGIFAAGPTALGSGAVGMGSTGASITGSGISAAEAGLGGLYAGGSGAGMDMGASALGEGGGGGLGSFTMPNTSNILPVTGETLGGTGTALNAAPNLTIPGSQYWSMNNPIINSALTGALKGGITSGLTGGNPLKGALTGALTNGLGEGLAANGIGSGGLNSSVIGALAGAYLGNKTDNALQGQITNLQQLFGPNSAYATQLKQELERKDAAAGRRSQYGPREVELQARLAQLASGQAGTLNQLYNQQNSNRNLMLSSLLNNGAVSKGVGSLIDMFGGGSNGTYREGGMLDPNTSWDWTSGWGDNGFNFGG